ncbi:MAG: RICIN domain-containing protein [Clostridia bacterium]|nr:RICIN domain-containing protein [Clostridia bacterium]
MKKVTAILLSMMVMLSTVGVIAEEGTKIFVNGEEIGFNNDCVKKDGTVYLPVREYADIFGAEVSWNNEEKIVEVFNNGVEVEIPIGEKWFKKQGLKYTVKNESCLVGGVSYMPLEVLDAFDSAYEWDGEGAVKINTSVLNGKYVVITYKDNYVMTLEGEESENKGKISVAENKELDSQIWLMESRGSNVYRMINKENNKAVDISSNSKNPGVIFATYSKNGGNNQNFVPEKCKDGYYIKCYHSDLYATVGENSLVTQEEFTGAENQVFNFVVVGENEIVKNVKVEDSVIDPMGNKFFTIKGDKIDGVYKLILQGEGKYLIIDKNTKKSITGSAVDFSKGQIFSLEEADGKYYLKDGNGSYFMNKTAFEITEPEITPPARDEDSMGGKYYTLTHKATGKKLIYNGEALTIADGDDWWGFIASGEDMFTLINKNVNKAIDIPGASVEEGKAAIVYDANYNDNQVFVTEFNPDGSFCLKNKNSGMYLALKDNAVIQSANKKDAFTAEYKDVCNLGKRMAATVTPFLLKGEDAVTNVKLQWNEIGGATEYDVYRSVDGGEYKFHTSLEGITVDDYDLELGKSYQYRVYALSSAGLIESAETKPFTPYELPCDMLVSGNLEPSGMSTPGGGMQDKDGLYYRFSQKSRTDGGKGFGTMVMSTSEDGVTYTEPKVVLTVEDMLAHETCKDIEDIRFESVNIKYNPKANNFGFIAHAEKGSGGYGFARISIATYTPGDEKMVFHGAVRPGGDDVRDLNTFIDDDGTTYIMGATHGNADLAIYRLKDDWSGIDKRVALINKGKWRELPNVLKVDGIYYLFTSGCAGWYPTPGMYNSATSMEGPWSELRRAGNTTTFSSQSGYVGSLKTGEDNFYMNSYRWMGNWKDATVRTTQSLRTPVTVADGFAFYDYFEELLYNWEENCLIPVQRGRIVSQSMPNLRGSAWDIRSNANDGKYLSQWSTENKWPYVWEVDLGQSYNITQAQISWRIINGGEAYYQYKIEGSNDGINYTTILDRTKGYTDYGFTVDNMTGNARFVRLTVEKAVPRSERDYEAQLMEVKIIAK